MNTDDKSEQRTDVGPGTETSIDLRYYWRVLERRKWVIMATALSVASLAIVMTMRKPKIYEATATVIVDPQAPKTMGPESVEVVQLGAGQGYFSTEYYNTQTRILTSRQLSEKVVRKYDLQHRRELTGPPPPGATEDQLVAIATGSLSGRIRITPPRESRIFAISVQDTNRDLAQELANDVTKVYIDQNLDTKHTLTNTAKGWVAGQMDVAEKRLKDSERALYDFKVSAGVLSVSLEDQQNLFTRQVGSYSEALTETRKRRIELESRRKAIADMIASDALSMPSSYVSTASSIETLRSAYLQERRTLTVLKEKYGPKWPEVQAQQAKVDAAYEDLVTEGKTLIKSIDAEVAALKDSEGRLQGEIGRLTTEALELNKKELDYKNLQREAAQAAQNYSSLSKRGSESDLEVQDQANNIRELDLALKPGDAVAPNMRSAATVGILLGVLLALGLAFFIEFLDRSVKTQEDIEQVIRLPYLGMVPRIEGTAEDAELRTNLYIAKHPTSNAAEWCRGVRTNIMFASPDKPLRTLVVSSSNASEGKTLTAINLGIVMAQSGQRTLLVDTDMRRPRLHRSLGCSNENGISRLILGETDVESAVKSTEVPNLFLLPCGPHPPNPAELLQTEKFLGVMEQLRGKFDRVIFDSPPLLMVTDAVILSSIVDGTILVVRAGQTSRDAVLRAKRAMGAVNTNIIGVILNDVDLRNPHYSSYNYYYQYKYQDAPAPAGAGNGEKA